MSQAIRIFSTCLRPSTKSPPPSIPRDDLAVYRAELELIRAIEQGGRREVNLRPGSLGGPSPSPTPAPPRRRWRVYGLAALAAALLLVVALGPGRRLWQPQTSAGTGGAQAGPPQAGDPLSILAPGFDVSIGAPVTFAWRGVPQARLYIVEVFTPEGILAVSRRTSDTSFAVPADSLPQPGEYRWWVRARIADGTERTSLARRLRLRPL